MTKYIIIWWIFRSESSSRKRTIYTYLNMNSFVNYTRYLLVLFIMISCLATLVVLGLDLDMLLNGPDYLSGVITNIVNRSVRTVEGA